MRTLAQSSRGNRRGFLSCLSKPVGENGVRAELLHDICARYRLPDLNKPEPRTTFGIAHRVLF